MISERVYTDKEGRIFYPMNVEGNSYHENFITTPKIFVMVAEVAWLVLMIVNITNNPTSNWTTWVINILVYLLVSQWVIRKFIFEEKYYYKMYKEFKKEKITTPAAFWYIASLKDTEDGCLITYVDGKIGYLIRLEKDTITGKPPEFMEEHFDGISDFYRELNKRQYKYIQSNIMEVAGKDERLKELDKMVYMSDNTNLQKLMQYQVGYIKNVARRALYETDYFLIYTTDLNRIDSMGSDIADCVSHLLDGAYISYSVLDSDEINEMVKEQNGVKYFNPTDATLKMFNREGARLASPFKITDIEYTDGDMQEITNANRGKLLSIEAKLRNKQEIKGTIKETLEIKGNKKEISWLEACETPVEDEEQGNKDAVKQDNILDELNSFYAEEFVEDDLDDFEETDKKNDNDIEAIDEEIIDF